MSFQLSEVKYKSNKENLNTTIKGCFGVIKQVDILTDNIKYGLGKYINFRFTKRNSNTLKKDTFKKMIQDMLEFTCSKPYISISKQDVINNEDTILYEIKKAIVYGSTRQLYYDELSNSKDLNDFYNCNYKPIVHKLNKVNLQDTQVVEEYFKGLEI